MRHICGLKLAAVNARPVRQRGIAIWLPLGLLAGAGALASAVIWGMHITAKSPGIPEYSKPVTADSGAPGPSAVSRDAIARMFGGTAALSTGARDIEGVQLLGIVADKRGSGVALISVDGAPPVRVRAGGKVRDGVTLAEIRERKVVLEQGGTRVERDLPVRVNLPVAAAPGKAPGFPPIPSVPPVAQPGGSPTPGAAGSGALPTQPLAR